jgi:hypothetical protein
VPKSRVTIRSGRAKGEGALPLAGISLKEARM